MHETPNTHFLGLNKLAILLSRLFKRPLNWTNFQKKTARQKSRRVAIPPYKLSRAYGPLSSYPFVTVSMRLKIRKRM